MKEKVGEVFSIAADNPPVPGCTISKPVYNGGNDIIYFSLASNTDISAEIRYLMGQWNQEHPDKEQKPIFRENMIGTIYFPVAEYFLSSVYLFIDAK